jgi:hypothetical protein
MSLAERLVNELMLVSVLVAGEGAEALAAELADAGAAADLLQGGQAPEGFDLAILLTDAHDAASPRTRALVDALARSSDRLLLAPIPLGEAEAGNAPALPELPLWFEMFAELGYQPVVEFDASFVSAGAFLVDRAATADEADLAAFTDRLQLGTEAASARRWPKPSAMCAQSCNRCAPPWPNATPSWQVVGNRWRRRATRLLA